MIEHITTHREQALARLMFAMRNKPNIAAVIRVMAGRYQGLEDVLWQLYTERSIETGEGVQLDILGKILREPRGDSADDDAYRLRLKARQRANRSSGTVEDILGVFATLLGSADDLLLQPYFPASLSLTILDVPITEAVATLYASFLSAAKAAAVKAFLVTSPADEENTFAFPASTTLTLDHDGEATMRVVSTEGFPASGSVLLDVGTTDQLRVAYTGKTATTFEGCNAREGVETNRATGALVVEAPHPLRELTVALDVTSDTTIAIGDTSAFPSAGFVAVGPMSALTEYRIVEYTGKTATHLTGLVDTGIGGETLFLVSAPVAWVGRSFGSDGEDFGGQLARVIEA